MLAPGQGGLTELLAEMREVLDGIEVGMSVRSACLRARVNARRLQAWLELAADGEEPFAAWYEALGARSEEGRYQILSDRKAMAAHDPRANVVALDRWGEETAGQLPRLEAHENTRTWGRAAAVRRFERARAHKGELPAPRELFAGMGNVIDFAALPTRLGKGRRGQG
jgi:hypothetical protein